MVMLKREHIPLRRDVIFLATADEEVEHTGTDWMIAHHRELLQNAEFLITEGGENPLERGKVQYVGIDVAEKSPLWLRVTAIGRAGHASRPTNDSAPNRLVRALNRLLDYRPDYKVLPLVAESLRDAAPLQPPDRAAYFRDISQALHDRNFRRMLEQDNSLNFMLRDTITLTMLGGSRQTNVIPTEAWATLDVRLLPGEDPNEFLNQIRRVIADPAVTVQPFKPFVAANSSPTNTALFDSLSRVSKRYFPGAPVIPRLNSGYTENQRFRQLGVVSYGFSPFVATPEEAATEHGDNERIRVEEVQRGPRMLYDVVVDIAGGK
jgi:acetylornithine deacetylase/succinyl-diaminopimelate desuccinylase-like protein